MNGLLLYEQSIKRDRLNQSSEAHGTYVLTSMGEISRGVLDARCCSVEFPSSSPETNTGEVVRAKSQGSIRVAYVSMGLTGSVTFKVRCRGRRLDLQGREKRPWLE